MSDMALRYFEERDHVTLYQEYRPSSPSEVQKLILGYLQRKKEKPFSLAVDIGCGSGQSTRGLASHFDKVVGVDFSEAQIEEARKIDGPDNVSYSLGQAEELEFVDGSVDLVTVGQAVHWFDLQKFLKEVARILKPRGCVALYCHRLPELCSYADSPENPAQMIEEMFKIFKPYEAPITKLVWNEYQEILDAITFPDKERAEDVYVKMEKPISWIFGFLKSTHMYQRFLKEDPENAKAAMKKVEQRLLKAFGMSSETLVEFSMKYFCVLASKPEEI